MQVQKHINNEVVDHWYRCKHVTSDDKSVSWELLSTPYSLIDAYSQGPHVQLVNAMDDKMLCVFVKAWGPLRLSLNNSNGTDRIEDYRFVRDRLRADAQLLESIAKPPDIQRSALMYYAELLREYGPRPSLRN